MATRTITHFKVGAKLFNDITNLLLQLPAGDTRILLNRIESKAECEAIYKVDLVPKKLTMDEFAAARHKLKRKAPRAPARKKTHKKVAKSKRRS